MTRGFNKTYAILRRKYHQPLTPSRIVGWLLTLIALMMITAWPAITGDDGFALSKPGTWLAAVTVGWPALFAGFYLKYSERIRSAKQRNGYSKNKRIKKKLTLSSACSRLTDMLKATANPNASDPSEEEVRNLRSSILTCIQIAVGEMYGHAPEHGFECTLLAIDKNDDDILRVVSRTTDSRDSHSVYQFDQTISGEAITSGSVAFEDNWRASRAGVPDADTKSYQSVLGIPVTRNKLAYGAVAIDSLLTFAFATNADDLAIELEPYIAMLAATFTEKDAKKNCNYRAPTR